MTIRDLRNLVDADPKSEVHLLTRDDEEYGWLCDFVNRDSGHACTLEATAYWEETGYKSKHIFCTRHILNPANGAIY